MRTDAIRRARDVPASDRLGCTARASDTNPIWAKQFQRLADFDLLLIGLATLFALFLGVRLDFFEGLADWTRGVEPWQIDELLIALLVCLGGLSLSVLKRWKESRAEINARMELEARISRLLGENRRLSRQMIHALERERLDLARELHDEMGQCCNAIKVDAASIAAGTREVAPAAHASCLAIMEVADHLHGIMRSTMHRLRPAALDDLGLAAAIQDLVESWEQRHGITCAYVPDGCLDGLGETLNITIYRVLQECLNNIAKHSGARHVAIRLERRKQAPAMPLASDETEISATGDCIVLRIVDDGIGLGPDVCEKGFGILGMKERVSSQGGFMTMQNVPGRGLQVLTVLPLVVPENAVGDERTAD